MSNEIQNLALSCQAAAKLEGGADAGIKETLLKTEALQNAIFNSANFSSIATDEKGVIQIFNVGAERMLGYTSADVLNRITPAEIADPQELISRAQALSEEMATPILPGFEALVYKASRGIEDIYELSYIRKNGSRFPAVVSVTALRDPRDAIIGYLLIGTNNTARKQVEEEKQRLVEIQEMTNEQLQKANATLRVSEVKLTVTLNSIGDGVIVTDAGGRVTFLNPVAGALTGWTQAEACGHPVDEIFNIINQETRQPSAIPVMATLAHGTIQGMVNHTVLLARNGGECAIADSCAPIRDPAGQIAGAILVFRDVTDEFEAQQALESKNANLENAITAAEMASLAKSTFLSSMSHELRTPLNAILGFAQLLEAGSPALTDTQFNRVGQITQAGWYLLELINEILDLSVIESGKLSLSRESVSLAEIIRECQVMIEPQAEKRGVQMDFLAFDNTFYVNADRTRLKQVMFNLLSNAIKYNKKLGTVEVKCTGTPERILIRIKDSGVGLSPEKLLQLFQPFNRLGQENGSEEGTGIGLVVTKRLIELMGGSISVESTAGVGSEFCIELIRDVIPQLATFETQSAESAAQTDMERYSLLYVEDNPANLLLVEQIIEDQPHIRMLSARDGNQGVALARTYLPDVILMDINLPGINGIEAMNILRKQPQTAHIPIIALSANAMPGAIKTGMEAGFFRYLTKPIRIPEFMGALNEALAFSETKLDDTNRIGSSK